MTGNLWVVFYRPKCVETCNLGWKCFTYLKKNYLVIQIIRNLITVIVTLSCMNEFAIGIQVLLQLVVLEWCLKMV